MSSIAWLTSSRNRSSPGIAPPSVSATGCLKQRVPMRSRSWFKSGAFDAVARRQAEYYLDFFAGAEPEAEPWPSDEWLADYGPRIDNLRAALDWAFSPVGDASIGVALTAAAVPVWIHLSLIEECRRRVERALAAIAAGTGGDARCEMKLYVALTHSLRFSRGAGFSEIGAAGTRALELAESLGNAEYQLRALWGLWGFRFSGGQHRAALTLAQKFDALAAKGADLGDRLIGQRMIGVSQYYLGELLPARRHLERMLAHSVASTQMSQIVRFEGNVRVVALAYLARILWLQGLPDQAMRAAERCVADGRATNHAISLGQALAVAACPVTLWVGDLAAADITWKCCSTIQRGMNWGAGASLAAAMRECWSSSAAMSTPD